MAALLKQHFDAEARAQWESDQTTRRESFEKDQARRQLEWQQQQEVKRQAERVEDLARAEDQATPKLHVSISQGVRSWGPTQIPVLMITARNVGRVPVHIDPPFLTQPDGPFLHTIYATEVLPSNWQDASYSAAPLPHILQPTQVLEVQWVLTHLREKFRQQYSGVIEIKGMVRDGTAKLHYSEPYRIDVDGSG